MHWSTICLSLWGDPETPCPCVRQAFFRIHGRLYSAGPTTYSTTAARCVLPVGVCVSFPVFSSFELTPWLPEP